MPEAVGKAGTAVESAGNVLCEGEGALPSRDAVAVVASGPPSGAKRSGLSGFTVSKCSHLGHNEQDVNDAPAGFDFSRWRTR
jgi:hypothetical protein